MLEFAAKLMAKMPEPLLNRRIRDRFICTSSARAIVHRNGRWALHAAVQDRHCAPGRSIRPSDVPVLDLAGFDGGGDRVVWVLRHDRNFELNGRATWVSAMRIRAASCHRAS